MQKWHLFRKVPTKDDLQNVGLGHFRYIFFFFAYEKEGGMEVKYKIRDKNIYGEKKKKKKKKIKKYKGKEY